MADKLQNVDYGSLDRAKLAFIDACKRTVDYAGAYGHVSENRFGGSANAFELDLRPWIEAGADKLFITLIPEGLGTADDAKPEDLTESEEKEFWHNIAFKTLAALTNDAATAGMQTVLVSLYLPSSTPAAVFDERFRVGFLDGFTTACKQVGCVYISGETPQLKTKIYPGKLDIAGALFAVMPVGVEPISGSELGPGDKIVLIQSSGPHENGYTVLREFADTLPDGYRTTLPSGKEYWRAINAPSVLYTPLIQKILNAGVRPSAIESISGHGWQKLMRSERRLRYVIDKTLPVPEVFSFIEERSGKSTAEMLSIFNYGAGYAIYTKSDDDAKSIVRISKELGLNAVKAGHVESSSHREVVVPDWNVQITDQAFVLKRG